jgi:hypothetical protein
MCRQYQPTPEPEPEPEPTPEERIGCPKPKEMEWNFGEVKGGIYTISTRSFPYEVSSTLDEFDIVGVNQMSSDLPSGVEMSINAYSKQATLKGALPTHQATYHVVYGFVDEYKCTVAILHAFLNVAGEQDTGPTTPSVPDLAVLITDVSVEQMCESKYSHAVTVYYETTGGINPVSIEGIYWTLPDGTTRKVTGISMASGWFRTQLSYPNGGEVSVRVEAEDAAGHTASDTGSAYLSPCYGTTTPPSSREVCFDVSAVVAAQQMATHYLPSYTEISVSMLINRKIKYVTPFDMCEPYGTQVSIQAPADFWTQQQQHLYFQGWQRYNEQTQQWAVLSENPSVNQNPNITLTLQNGGSLRAVYEEERLY